MNKQEVALDYVKREYLESGLLRHDEVSDQVQLRDDAGRWRNLITADINDMVCACSQMSGVCVSAKEVNAVLNSHNVPRVHPLRDYVNGCRAYTEEQGNWIGDYLAAQVKVEGDENEQQLWKEYFTRWFVGMIASWMKDEVVNHQVLVLIGRQGIYKTTWLEHLLPPELRAYGCRMANTSALTKDDRLRLAEYGLIALDEIDAMSPRELNVMKSVITATDVSERAAYRYNKERRLRVASFCASGNKEEFLTDITGNRRWLPFKVESIQPPFYTTLPYEQIYAQARYLVENDYPYWIGPEEMERLEEHNETFRAQEGEEQLLRVYFDIPAEGCGEFRTTAEIRAKLVDYGSIKQPLPLNKLGMILKKQGFKQMRSGHGGKRGWLVYEIPIDDRTANRRIDAKG